MDASWFSTSKAPQGLKPPSLGVLMARLKSCPSRTSFKLLLAAFWAAHVGGFKSTAGFDAVTGWGSPKGKDLLAALTKVL